MPLCIAIFEHAGHDVFNQRENDMKNPTVVRLPQKLTPASVSKFGCELHELSSADEFEFDFGAQRWFPPFSMLLLAMHLRRFREHHPRQFATPRTLKATATPLTWVFSRHLGSSWKRSREALGSSTYVPIQPIKRTELTEKASKTYVELGVTIEEKAGALSTILTQKDHGVLHDTLTYSIREILRNVFEHSGADEVFICAQHWPSRNEVEVGIVDAGIGIKAGLAENPNFQFETHRESLHAALMPGVSGNIWAGKGNDPWMNTGYGLI